MEFLLAGNSPKNNAYAEERRRRCADYAKVVTQLRELGFLKKTGPISLSSKGRKYIKEKVEIHLDGLPERKDFAIHVGPIGSGTTVQRDPHIFDKLSEQMRKVIGLEMEASAIGAIAHTLRKEMIVMKGVMDYADQDKNDNFKKFAARASAECLVAFLRQNLPEFHAPKANPVQRTRPSGTGNLQTDLLGQDIVRGEKALDSLTKSGADAVPGVLEWLKFSDGSLPRTIGSSCSIASRNSLQRSLNDPSPFWCNSRSMERLGGATTRPRASIISLTKTPKYSPRTH